MKGNIIRKLDEKGRMLLPVEYLIRFRDGQAYFQYNPQKKEIYVLSAGNIQEIRNDIESIHGKLSYTSDAAARLDARQIGGDILISYVQSNGRIIVPEIAKKSCGINFGEELEVLIQDNRITIRAA